MRSADQRPGDLAVVFVVHSGITWLAAELVARRVAAGRPKVTVSVRGTRAVSDSTRIDLELSMRTPSTRNLVAIRRRRYEITKALEQVLSGRDFELVTPQLCQFEYRILAAQRTCKEVSYIEEGLVSVAPPQPRRWAHRRRHVIKSLFAYGWSRRFGLLDSLTDDYFPFADTATFYAVSDNAFGWSERRVQLNVDEMPRTEIEERVVVAVDRFREEGEGLALIERIIPKLSTVLASTDARLALKMHPAQSSESSTWFAERIEAALGHPCRLINPDTIMELLGPGHVVFVGGSSLSLYLPMTDNEIARY